MEMKPGASPHCGMNAVFGAVGEPLDGARGFDVLGEVEIVRAGALGGLGDRGRQIVGRGGEHDVVALDLVRRTSGDDDVDLAQLDIVVARHALEARRHRGPRR